MKKTVLLLVSVCIVCTLSLKAQSNYSFKKDTYLFAVKGEESLYLDKYSPILQEEKTPCIIFVFGGAFARGARDVEKYIPYFNYLVEHGYTVVSIDYRLGLKNINQEKNLNEEKFINIFIHTLDMALEDFFDATNYVLERADEWNIDRNMIIANGSSAGAVTVLQAEYDIINGSVRANRLPIGFNYAGVVAFAGAIFTLEGGLVWNGKPCPIMMFHGNGDVQVPYDQLKYNQVGFYGAKYIAETLDRNDYPYYFYKFDDYGHEIASDPMQQNKEDMLWFLNTFVKDNKQYKVVKEQQEIGRPEKKKDFTFEDYVRGNFDR